MGLAYVIQGYPLAFLQQVGQNYVHIWGGVDISLKTQAAEGNVTLQTETQIVAHQLPRAMAEERKLAYRVDPARPSLWAAIPQHLLALLIALALGTGAFWLYTRNNNFPELYYHPDEWGKADQISGVMSNNFNHPLLMLEATQKVIEYFKLPSQSRYDIAVAGRTTAAGLGAVVVVAGALTGYLAYGFIGLLICGLTLGLCPPLLVNAHFFKEDTSLLAGIFVTILAARWTLSARWFVTRLLSAIVLGAGVGIAMSGKYVGAVTLVPALAALFIAPTRKWYLLPLRTILCLATMLAVAHKINERAFVSWNSFKLNGSAQSGFFSETHHAVEGHYGIGLRIPNTFWLRMARAEMLPHLWLFIAVGVVWFLYRRKFSRWGIVLLLFPITFAAMLTCNTLPMARYALPVTISFYFIAAALVSSMLVDWTPRFPKLSVAGSVACLGAVLLTQGYWCRYINDCFGDDGRQALRNFVATKLPPQAYIAVDNHAGLHSYGDRVRHPDQPTMPQRLMRSNRQAAEMAPTIEAMAQRGITHVAASELNFGRYFDPETQGIPAERQAEFEQEKRFYEQLFSRAELVWQSHPTPPRYPTHGWVDIDLRLYDITHLKPAQ